MSLVTLGTSNFQPSSASHFGTLMSKPTRTGCLPWLRIQNGSFSQIDLSRSIVTG